MNGESVNIKNVERALRRVLRIGKVVGLDAASCRARVEFPDNSGIVSYEMPVIQPHTFKDKFYSMPSLDEFVLCAFLPIGTEAGFIVGSYYSKTAGAPVAGEGKFNVTFEDGTFLEYDKTAHILTADVKGAAHVKTEKEIIVTAGADITVNCGRAVNVSSAKDITVKADGDISVACSSADVKADKVTVKSPDITLGEGAVSGVVTGECFCALTGGPHPDKSAAVKAAR